MKNKHSFELADYPDKDSFFKFQPCLKLHHQRNNIVYDRDIMVLQSADSMFTRPINLAVSISNEIKKERSNAINRNEQKPIIK